jgi:phosphatidylglycerol:prolipoprotein diacylglycerol transferase
MFPTISSLINAVLGTHYNNPIPTFGFFVALAFICSYFTFLSEFKRKEKEGVIFVFQEKHITGEIAIIKDYLSYGFLALVIGTKVIGAFLNQDAFFRSPLAFIFSIQGTWLVGLLCALSAIILVYALRNSTRLNSSVQKSVLMHPYELMPQLILWAALWGFLGAKAFNFLENINLYAHYSFIDFWRYSGLTFYGGLVFGALSYLYIGMRRGMRLIDLADIGSPGMLVAYGVGRLGCHLSGDGDWGIVNANNKLFKWLPDWVWAYRFPHNVLNRGEYIYGCSGNFCAILPKGVYPTSLYESVIILLAWLTLWHYKHSIKQRGAIFCIYLIISGLERFLIENIRLNYLYRLGSLHLSEAQIISLLLLMGGCIGSCRLLYIKKRKSITETQTP